MQRKIAIVGVPPLEALGIETIISESSGYEILNFSSPNQLVDSGKGADVCITTGETFISNLSFFTLRKERTIILSPSLSQDMSQPYIVNTCLPVKEIADRIKSVIKMCCHEVADGESLSGREIEVLRLIANGDSYKEIANKLFISLNTVMTHKKNISAKLGIHSYSGLSLYAIMNGYGKPSETFGK